ncbi:MAG: hypothetical protein MR380_06160 [Lachnospiraceae bacterium]|nr:hypothetical protein [Lachnospiraceae bacterium]
MENFFTLDKLSALRKIALRRTADRVNLVGEKAKKEAGGNYYTEEKILVGISTSPSNPKIIRTAARMAKAFDGSLIGLYVETSNFEKRSMEDKKRLKENIHLAEQLGAKIETVCGEDVPFLLAEYARNSGISKIVTGRSAPSYGLMKKLLLRINWLYMHRRWISISYRITILRKTRGKFGQIRKKQWI